MRRILFILSLCGSAPAWAEGSVEWACVLPGASIETRAALNACPVVYEIVAHFLDATDTATSVSRDCKSNFAPASAVLSSHTKAALNLGNRVVVVESDACYAEIRVQIGGEFPRKQYVRRGSVVEGQSFVATELQAALGRKQTNAVSFYEPDDEDRTPSVRIKNTGATCLEVQGYTVRPGDESEKIVLEAHKTLNGSDETSLNRISLKSTENCLTAKAAPVSESGPSPSPAPAAEGSTSASPEPVNEPGVEPLLR